MNKIKKFLFASGICIILVICTIIIPIASNASTITNDIFDTTDSTLEYYIGGPQTRNLSDNNMEISDLNGKESFIKNAYTGQYLDVSGGTAADGT